MARKESHAYTSRIWWKSEIVVGFCEFDVIQYSDLIDWNQYLPVGALYTHGDVKFEFRARKNPMAAVTVPESEQVLQNTG